MNLEETLRLFDSCWFEMEIFKDRSKLLNPWNSNQNPDEKIKQNLSSVQCIDSSSTHKRSKSDDLSSRTSFLSEPLSPNTVLLPAERKLETALSGQKIAENEKIKESDQRIHTRRCRRGRRSRRRRKKNRRSFSDLEMEELKGFMDLGFVFTEKDRNSELAEILPGLKRFLGEINKSVVEPEEEEQGRRKTRPYLSEAWDVRYHRGRRNKKGLMALDWRIPAISNEMAMKDNLRWWAHTVASTVR